MLSVDHARWCVSKRSIFASRSSAAIVSSPTLACSRPISAIPRVSRPALQRRLARGQEPVTPAAQLGGGDAELARDQLQVLAPQQAEHGLPLASRRHPPPRLGRGPVSASVAGALRRARAHPNVLVHPPPPCSLLPAKRCLSGTWAGEGLTFLVLNGTADRPVRALDGIMLGAALDYCRTPSAMRVVLDRVADEGGDARA